VTAATRAFAPAPVEARIAVVLAGLLGCGAAVAGFGAAVSDLRLAAAGGATAAGALFVLMAAGWVDPLVVVVLSLPLPAFYSTPSLRIATAAPVTVVAVAAWLTRLGLADVRALPGRIPFRSLTALAMAVALATVTAQYPLTSIRESVNLVVLFALLVAATDLFRRNARHLDHAVIALVAAAAVCGVLAVLETLTILPGEFPRFDSGYNRAALGFGQPNGLGLFLALALPLGVHRFQIARGPGRWAAAFALLSAAAGLIATFSRGAWLALLAGTIALVFTGDRRLVLRVWLAAALLVLVTDVASGGAMRETVERSIGDWVIEQRAALMLAGILMFMAYPLTGVGPGGYAGSLDRFGPQIPQLWDYLPTPHNAYVQMAAETGLFGLIAFTVFLGATVVAQVRRTRVEDATASAERASLNRALLWSFATCCAAGMVVWPLAHGTGQAVVLLAAGIFAVPPAKAG
jgi:O-antigen ligase